jgi:hypothetical protein
MKTSDLFTMTKVALEFRKKRGTAPYICWSLADLFENNYIERKDCVRGRVILYDLLGHSSTLESWLLNGKHTTKRALNSSRGKEKAYATRQAWLDHLIEHYKALGD